MQMPEPDAAIIARKAEIVRRLQAVLPPDAVIHDPAEVRAYECDALTAYRCPPLAAVLPRSTAEVAAVLKVCHAEGVPVVPRGAGTSLAGGSLPTADCVLLGVARPGGGLAAERDRGVVAARGVGEHGDRAIDVRRGRVAGQSAAAAGDLGARGDALRRGGGAEPDHRPAGECDGREQTGATAFLGHGDGPCQRRFARSLGRFAQGDILFGRLSRIARRGAA
jgi:hypothetical protein